MVLTQGASFTFTSYTSQNSWVSGLSLMLGLHLTFFSEFLNLCRTFFYGESMPSSSGLGGDFTVSWELLPLLQMAGPVFKKRTSKFAKRVDYLVSIFYHTTTITIPTTITTMKKTYKQTKGHRRLGKVMTMFIPHGDGVQVLHASRLIHWDTWNVCTSFPIIYSLIKLF